jgi:RNA polymerase sigma-70 factor (ECF subfamily)
MLRLQAGEDTALNALMDRWQKPLAQFILRFIGNPTEAIDLAQETFVRVYEHRARYRATAPFSSWLFAIAANLCKNHLRWRARHPTVALDAELDQPKAPSPLTHASPTPAEAAERNEQIRRVQHAIQTLPHDLRTALFLFEYQEMSHAEIATVLGCTPKAVETRLYRARQTLRENLKENRKG